MNFHDLEQSACNSHTSSRTCLTFRNQFEYELLQISCVERARPWYCYNELTKYSVMESCYIMSKLFEATRGAGPQACACNV